MSDDTTKKALTRLRRVAGQVEGVQRMVEEGRYCVDVIAQVSAARAALGKVSSLLLENHIETCVRDAFDSKNAKARDAKIAELIRVYDRSCRC